MKVSGAWLSHEGTQALCRTFAEAGASALFVGGCVRNGLLGVAVDDVDIATDALPETVIRIAELAGFRAVPTGIDHGTVTVIARGKPHEVTTFRRDVETHGRHATVAFSTEIAEDAARRDFTMNALYADASGQVIDPLGGLPDLLARHVRFVGDPTQRIMEDYLRILRFFRFTAIYGDPCLGIDTEGLSACAALSEGIEALSKERIGAEMRKLLAAPDPAPAVAAMAASGVMARALPGADARALAPLVHLEGDLPPDALRRLAVLGGEDPTTALRLSRAEVRDLARLLEAAGSVAAPAALGWRLGLPLATSAVLVRAALLESPLMPDWMAEVARGAAAVCPVSAADLQPGFSGAELGRRLAAVQAKWLASGLHLTREELLH